MAAGPIQERNQDATIYVGGLDEKITETLLWELFLQAGPVVNVHIPRDRITQSHQGYGFVEFMGEDDADYAIKIMNMIKLYGKPIRVNKAASNTKNLDVGANVFIGNLDPEIDEKLLYDIFSAFGVILQTPKIMRDPETGNSKGFAFINFASFDASDAAIEAMNGQHLCNRAISVSYAFKKDSKGERHGTAAERMLAAQNPLTQMDRPHQLFADAPPTLPGPQIPPPMNIPQNFMPHPVAPFMPPMGGIPPMGHMGPPMGGMPPGIPGGHLHLPPPPMVPRMMHPMHTMHQTPPMGMRPPPPPNLPRPPPTPPQAPQGALLATPNIPPNVPQGMPQLRPPTSVQQSVPHSMPQNVPMNVPQNFPQSIPHGVPQNIPHGVPQNVQQNVEHSVPQNIPQSVPQNVPQSLPQPSVSMAHPPPPPPTALSQLQQSMAAQDRPPPPPPSFSQASPQNLPNRPPVMRPPPGPPPLGMPPQAPLMQRPPTPGDPRPPYQLNQPPRGPPPPPLMAPRGPPQVPPPPPPGFTARPGFPPPPPFGVPRAPPPRGLIPAPPGAPRPPPPPPPSQ